jgi:hypothetical protein
MVVTHQIMLGLFGSLSKLLGQSMLFRRRLFLLAGASVFFFAAPLVADVSNFIGVLHECISIVDSLGVLLLLLFLLFSTFLLALGSSSIFGLLFQMLSIDGSPEVFVFSDTTSLAQFIVEPLIVDDLDVVFERGLHFGDARTPVGFGDDEMSGGGGEFAVEGAAVGFRPLLEVGEWCLESAREANDGVLESGSHRSSWRF